MGGLTLIGATDVVRSFGSKIEEATPASVAAWLRRHRLAQAGAGFNYDPAIKGTADVLRGRLNFAEARERVGLSGRAFGRPYNVAVFDALEPYLASCAGQAYPLPYTAIKIGTHKGVHIHVGLKAPIVRVPADGARIVYPAFRSSYLPTWQQAGFEASIAQYYLAQNDFYGVDGFEYLCVRSGKNALDRQCEVITEAQLEMISPDRINALLSTYFCAVGMLLDEGLGAQPSRMAGYHVVDPDAGDLFM